MYTCGGRAGFPDIDPSQEFLCNTYPFFSLIISNESLDQPQTTIG